MTDPREPDQTEDTGIDMSPAAIDARLRELDELYEFGMAMKEIRWLDPREAPKEWPLGHLDP